MTLCDFNSPHTQESSSDAVVPGALPRAHLPWVAALRPAAVALTASWLLCLSRGPRTWPREGSRLTDGCFSPRCNQPGVTDFKEIEGKLLFDTTVRVNADLETSSCIMYVTSISR